MIKLIASDMDGTLFDESKNFPPDFEEVLEELEKKKIIFACASGRSYPTLKMNFKDIKHNITYICDNGAFCCDNNGVFFKSVLPHEEIQDIISECEKFDNVKVVLCGENIACHNIEPNDPYFKHFSVFYSDNKYFEDLHEAKGEFIKVAICDLKGIYTQCAEPISQKFGEKFAVTVTGDCWMDINEKHVNKGYAIKMLQKKLNISESETMTFGDFYNDIEMLQSAKYSFIMENAVEDMKQYGNYIAPNNNEFGVTKTIKKFCLNKGDSDER